MVEVSPVYFVSAVRTPIAKAPYGAFRKTHPADLAEFTIREAVRKANLTPSDIDKVIEGCATQTGPQGFNIARTATIKALGPAVPAHSINMLCGSGLAAIIAAANSIQSGERDIIVAGGVENNDMVMQGADLLPTLTEFKPAKGFGGLFSLLSRRSEVKAIATKILKLKARVVQRSLPRWYEFHDMAKSGGMLAKELKISREECDDFSARSQRKAAIAQHEERFNDEISPFIFPDGSTFSHDEGIRSDTTIKGLSRLKALSGGKSALTAGSSSQKSAGSAALVLASLEAVKKHNLIPLARYVTSAEVGTNPMFAGQQLIGPAESIKEVLNKANLSIDDIGLFELNEAFASVVIAAQRELRIPDEKLNVNGGAIAFGHPLGVSGARLPVTLIHEMIRNNVSDGVVSLCVGGGQAISAVFEIDDFVRERNSKIHVT